jgi:hypothetical protein
MWKKLFVMVALVSVPVVSGSDAFADKAKDAARKQALADKARASAAKHAEKGNNASSKNMQKIAEQRQKAADRAAKKK